MSFSFRKLHSAISSAYHFTFSVPNLYNLINDLDNLSSADFIKLSIINGVNHLTNKYRCQVLSKLNDIENKKETEFCNIIKSIIFETKTTPNIYSDLLSECVNAIKSSSISNYYLIGYFYDNYLDKYNNIIDKLKTINTQINDITCVDEENPELVGLKQQKDEIYLTLITDFIIEVSAHFYDEFVFRSLKNMFVISDDSDDSDDSTLNKKERLPFKQMCDVLNEGKKLLNAHNENINKL